jgi:hypothetical protein
MGEFAVQNIACITKIVDLRFCMLESPSYLLQVCTPERGSGSSVGIVTDYGLDSPGLNPGGVEIFHPSRPVLRPTQPPVKMGTGSFPGVKCGRGVGLTTHPLLVPRSCKSRAIPLLTLWAFVAYKKGENLTNI